MPQFIDLLVGTCSAKGEQVTRCIHNVKVKYEEKGAWMPYLNTDQTAYWDGIEIFKLYETLSKTLLESRGAPSSLRPTCGLNERQIADRVHFETYEGLKKGEKRKGKYKKASRPEKKSKRDREEAGESATTAASTAAAAAAVAKIPTKPLRRRTASRVRSVGDSGGGRLLNSPNKRRERARAYSKTQERQLSIENVVCKAVTHPNIDQLLVKLSMNGSHDVDKFPNSTVHLKNISHCGPGSAKASVSLTNSGQLGEAGANTTEDALLAMTKFSFRICRLSGKRFKLENFHSVNYATSMRVAGAIDLEKFEKKHKGDHNISYDKDVFKGLIWTLSKDRVVVVMFKDGAVNVVGLKNQKHVDYAREHLCPFIEKETKSFVNADKPKVATAADAAAAGLAEEFEEDLNDPSRAFTKEEMEQLESIKQQLKEKE